MPVNIVEERFPVSIVDNGSIKTFYQPVKTHWNGFDDLLFKPNRLITRVLISCHGVGADARAYAENGRDAARAAGLDGETLVIAPQFANPDDLFDPGQLDDEPRLLYWNGGRFWGQLSADTPSPRSGRISSFTVIDQLLAHLIESGFFPNLTAVVLTGQSGGGQLALHYAFAGRYSIPAHIDFRLVPMNPGSVPYVTAARPVPNSDPLTFAVPDNATLAAAIAAIGPTGLTVSGLAGRYNNYGYGFDGLGGYPYLNAQTPQEMVDRFRGRSLAYLIGENDTELDTSGRWRAVFELLQGVNRLARAQRYQAHLRAEDIWDSLRHVMEVIPGVGHNGRATMLSKRGLFFLFGRDPVATPDIAAAPSDINAVGAGGRVDMIDAPSTVPMPDGPGRRPVGRRRR